MSARRKGSVASTGAERSAADDEDIALARLCKALAHPARIAILRRLLAADVCVFADVAAATALAPSTAVQHLAVLREAGLVRQWNDGRRSCYCLDRARAEPILRLMTEVRETPPGACLPCGDGEAADTDASCGGGAGTCGS